MKQAQIRIINQMDKVKETDTNKLAINTYKNAISYLEIFRIYMRDFKPTIEFREFTIFTGSAYAVVSSFAVELFIKAILYKKSIKFGNTHKIEGLVDLLPKDIRSDLAQCDHWFEKKLPEISDAFVFYRYINENSVGYMIDFPFLQELMFRLEEISYRIVFNKE